MDALAEGQNGRHWGTKPCRDFFLAGLPEAGGLGRRSLETWPATAKTSETSTSAEGSPENGLSGRSGAERARRRQWQAGSACQSLHPWSKNFGGSGSEAVPEEPAIPNSGRPFWGSRVLDFEGADPLWVFAYPIANCPRRPVGQLRKDEKQQGGRDDYERRCWAEKSRTHLDRWIRSAGLQEIPC